MTIDVHGIRLFALRGLLLAPLLVLSTPAVSLEPFSGPGEFLEPGERAYQLSGAAARNPVLPDPVLDFSAGARFGLNPRHQFGVAAHYRRTGEDATLRNLHLDGQLRIHQGENVVSFLEAHASLIPADAERGLGSGHHEGGIRLGQWHALGNGLDLEWRAGLDRSESLTPSPDRRWRLINRMQAELNLYHRIAGDAELFLHMGGKQALPGEDSGSHTQLNLRPGLAWRSDDWLLRFSAGPNLARSDEVPRYTGEFTLSRRFAAPRPGIDAEQEIPRLRQRVRELEEHQDARDRDREERGEMLEELREAVETLQQAPPRPEPPVPEDEDPEEEGAAAEADAPGESAPAPASPRLEIINLTGRDAAGQRVAAELVARGYDVVATSDDPREAPPETTRIYYREGSSEEAIRIGHGMRGIQEVYRSDELEPGIEIQIRIGLDQFPSE